MEVLAGTVMMFGALCVLAVPVAAMRSAWRKRIRALLGGGAVLLAAGFAGLVIVLPPSDELAAMRAAEARAALKAEAARAATRAADRRAGRHCLTVSGKGVRSVVEAVKAALREPDSFEMIATSISPQTETGRHIVLMDYRARNGFGGMNVATARAVIVNDDCSIEGLVVE